MIPIVSISHLIVLPFIIFICSRLYISFRQTKEKSVGYFFLVFLTLIIMEAILASPGIITKDPLIISTLFALYPFFTFLSLAFIGALPFSILKMKKSEIFFIFLMSVLAIIITLINLNNVRLPPVFLRPPFIYWEDTRGGAMNIFMGIVGALVLLFTTLFFFINAVKSQDRHVRNRSLLISGGTAAFLFAAIINYVLGALLQQYITTLISTFLMILGSISVFSGVRHKLTD